ncbi:peptidylprolyl isomerase, partial [Mesorhizobium sp. P5_C1]
MQLKKLASFLIVLAGLVTSSVSAFAADPENTMIITLKDGDVTIALRPDLAPKNVAQIKKLVRQGAYDNVAFHRVIDGFMAQTGDVKFGNMK